MVIWIFPITIESSMTTIVFKNLKFPKNGTYLCIMGLRHGPLRANLMSAYSLDKFNCLSKLQLHVARSNLCRLPATSRVDAQRQLEPTGPKIPSSCKGIWKRQNKQSEGGRSQSFDKSSRLFGGLFDSEGHGYCNSSLGQNRKLPLHE